jgi:hypothetical protein
LPHDSLLFPRRDDMANVVELLHKEKKVLEHRLWAISQAIKALGGWASSSKQVKSLKRKSKKMSEATKEKLRKAAKARWAKIKKA